jgi:hypothetical protein
VPQPSAQHSGCPTCQPGSAQQLRNAFPESEAPGYLLHDRDGVFAAVATTVAGMNIRAVRTAPRAPWQNAGPKPEREREIA